jgi:hypothetical protein
MRFALNKCGQTSEGSLSLPNSFALLLEFLLDTAVVFILVKMHEHRGLLISLVPLHVTVVFYTIMITRIRPCLSSEYQ